MLPEKFPNTSELAMLVNATLPPVTVSPLPMPTDVGPPDPVRTRFPLVSVVTAMVVDVDVTNAPLIGLRLALVPPLVMDTGVASDATTAPEVGAMVSVPSLLETDDTATPPEQAPQTGAVAVCDNKH